MDALDALNAVGESNVQLVRQVGSDQWDGATPCTEWNVRSLVGHLIVGRHVYRGFLEGVPVAELRLILQQGGAAGDDPVAACESAVRSIRAAFAQPGALERTVHHTIGDMPGSSCWSSWWPTALSTPGIWRLPSAWTQGSMSGSSSSAMSSTCR